MTTTVGGVCISDEVGTLTLNAVPMRGLWTGIPDLSFLAANQPPQRGTNAVIPGEPGRLALPKRDDEDVVTLIQYVSGAYTPSDVAVAPAAEEAQLIANVRYLTGTVFVPSGSTIAAIVTLPHTAPSLTLTADVQVTGFAVQTKARGLIIAHLELTIPAGRFV